MWFLQDVCIFSSYIMFQVDTVTQQQRLHAYSRVEGYFGLVEALRTTSHSKEIMSSSVCVQRQAKYSKDRPICILCASLRRISQRRRLDLDILLHKPTIQNLFITASLSASSIPHLLSPSTKPIPLPRPKRIPSLKSTLLHMTLSRTDILMRLLTRSS